MRQFNKLTWLFYDIEIIVEIISSYGLIPDLVNYWFTGAGHVEKSLTRSPQHTFKGLK